MECASVLPLDANARSIAAISAAIKRLEAKLATELDGPLIVRQHRLLRAARAFIDPSLQLGRTTREEAYRVIEDQVAAPHAMANQKVERYTFRAPCQAPSYLIG